MAINTLLSSVSATLAQQSAPVAIRSSVNSATTQNAAATNTGTTPSYTSPSQSVVQNASLLTASSGFAQLGSLLEVAQTGTEQASTILQQLDSIAQQATNGGDVTGLDSEFQDLLAQLDGSATGTTFDGTSLLDGTFSGQTATTDNTTTPSLSLPNLTSEGLFGSSLPDISTPANAQSALAALSGAQEKLGSVTSNIGDVLAQLNFATATVNSALANSVAASSTLTESDLGSDSPAEAVTDLFLSKPSTTAQTQTANLPESLLSLLRE